MITFTVTLLLEDRFLPPGAGLINAPTGIPKYIQGGKSNLVNPNMTVPSCGDRKKIFCLGGEGCGAIACGPPALPFRAELATSES